MRIDVGDVQVMVAVHDRAVFGGNELRRRRRIKDENAQERRKYRFHGPSVQGAYSTCHACAQRTAKTLSARKLQESAVYLLARIIQ